MSPAFTASWMILPDRVKSGVRVFFTSDLNSFSCWSPLAIGSSAVPPRPIVVVVRALPLTEDGDAGSREQVGVNLLAGVVDDAADGEDGGRRGHPVERAGGQQFTGHGVGGLDVVLDVDRTDGDDALVAASLDVMGIGSATAADQCDGRSRDGQDDFIHVRFWLIKFSDKLDAKVPARRRRGHAQKII